MGDDGRFKLRQAPVTLNTNSCTHTLPARPSRPSRHTSLGACKAASRTLTVTNDRCLNASHTEGWGPFSAGWYWRPSRWALTLDILWWLSVVLLLLLCFGGSAKSQFCGTICPQTGSYAHLWHRNVELANCRTWKVRSTLTASRRSYGCSGTVSEAKVYTSPLLLFCCYRAIHVRSNTLKERLLWFALAYLAAQFK